MRVTFSLWSRAHRTQNQQRGTTGKKIDSLSIRNNVVECCPKFGWSDNYTKIDRGIRAEIMTSLKMDRIFSHSNFWLSPMGFSCFFPLPFNFHIFLLLCVFLFIELTFYVWFEIGEISLAVCSLNANFKHFRDGFVNAGIWCLHYSKYWPENWIITIEFSLFVYLPMKFQHDVFENHNAAISLPYSESYHSMVRNAWQIKMHAIWYFSKWMQSTLHLNDLNIQIFENARNTMATMSLHPKHYTIFYNVAMAHSVYISIFEWTKFLSTNSKASHDFKMTCNCLQWITLM